MKLFEMLQRLTLTHRLNDSYSCLVSFSTCIPCIKRALKELTRNYQRRFTPSLPSSKSTFSQPSLRAGITLFVCRAGFRLASCSCWMSTVRGTACAAVTGTWATWATCWTAPRPESWSTRRCSTTASPSAPRTSTVTGERLKDHT